MKRFLLQCFMLVFGALLPAALWGQNALVDELNFKGNDGFSDGRLKKVIHTRGSSWLDFLPFRDRSEPYDEDTFLSDLLRIEKFYHQEGYLSAHVADYDLRYSEDGAEVDITVHINEGEATTVDTVRFVPVENDTLPFEEERLARLLTLKKGKRYRELNLRQDYNRLVEWFSNRGYPYIEARVKPTRHPKEHTMTLTWYLNPGPFCEFGDIRITGNESISDGVIRRGLGFQEGKPFVQRKLLTAQSQIYRLELFRYVNLRVTDLEERPTAIPVQVQVKESVLRTLKLGVGYASEESFRGTLQWRHRNFFGGARILRAEAKHSRRLLPLQLEVELSQPYFLGSRNDLIIKPFFIWQDEPSFEARRIGVETTFSRQLTSSTNAFINSRIERDTVRVKGEEVSAQLDNLYNKSIIQLGVHRNTADLLFSPTRGSVTTITFEEAGLLLRSRFRYVKFTAEHRFYRTLAPNYVFAFRLFAGSMTPTHGREETPVEERFFSGGSYSVRGWERQQLGPQIVDPATGRRTPIGGNSKLEGSLELRFPIYKAFTGATFLDYGNVWDDWDAVDPLGLHYALGTGLRYETPIGPFRLDLAWKLNKQSPDEGRFQFHISIGQAF